VGRVVSGQICPGGHKKEQYIKEKRHQAHKKVVQHFPVKKGFLSSLMNKPIM